MLSDKEADAREYFVKNRPAFIIQAIPQIEPEILWDIHDAKYLDSLRSSTCRYNLGTVFSLHTEYSPTIGVNCITSVDDKNAPTWMSEVFADGHIVVVANLLCADNETPTIGNSCNDLL